MPNQHADFDADGTCRRCHQPHPGCRGHSKRRPGEPCGAALDPNAVVCKHHGGQSPNALAATEQRRQLREARTLVTTYGARTEINPIDSMLEQVYWSAGHIAWLRDVVQSLNEDDLTWGVQSETEREGAGVNSADFEATSVAAPTVWLTLYNQERRLHMDMCLGMIRAGIEERRVHLAEQQGQAVVGVITRIADALLAALTAAGLADTFVPIFRRTLAEAAPRELRALAA